MGTNGSFSRLTNENKKTLRSRAFNFRWATLESGVIPLTAADPDLPVPIAIIEGIQEYLNEPYLSYGPAEGLPEFCQGVADFYNRHKGGDIQPEEVFAINSAASGMFLVAQAVIEPGDEVIIADPVDFLLERSVLAAGGIIKRFNRRPDTSILEAIQMQYSSKTKMLSLCNPHNPTGEIFDRDTLEAILRWAKEKNIYIVSDEIWSDIVYDGATVHSVRSFDKSLTGKVFTVYGYSKSFGLAGLRIGALITPNPEWRATMVKLSYAADTAYGVATLSQIGAVSAMQDASWSAFQEILEHYQQNRNRIAQFVDSIPALSAIPPKATYLYWINIEQTGHSADFIVEHLRKNHALAVIPGNPTFFGPRAEGHIRLSFATTIDVLEEGLKRLREGLESL